jgi:hypothetical protein
MCCENCNEERDTETIHNQELCEECVGNLATCYSCDSPIIENYLVEGSDYCEDCYNDLPTCEHCEETVQEVNSNNHCTDCEDHYTDCGLCSCNVAVNECVTDSDSDYVCESCQENGCIPEDSSDWYDYDNLYQHRDGEWYTYAETKTINSYHDSVLEQIKGSYSGRYCGFELEILPKIDRDELAEEIYELGNLHCEEDSSLDEGGFEIISNYGDINDVLHIASELSNLLKGNAISHDTDCCGLHIHLTKSNDFDNAKMIVFWNDPENRAFIKMFARRESESYAAFDSKKNKKTLPKQDFYRFNDSDKYQAVRVASQTIEVRAFKGTTLKSTLLACIELAYYSYEYCKSVNSGEDLTYTKFLEWLPEESIHIKPYFESKKEGVDFNPPIEEEEEEEEKPSLVEVNGCTCDYCVNYRLEMGIV